MSQGLVSDQTSRIFKQILTVIHMLYMYCAGECDANPAFMLIQCRQSCGTCDVADEKELDALIERTIDLYEVGGDETLLETPYGVKQIVDPADAERVLEVIRNFTFYMDHLIFTNPKYQAVKKTCKNRHPECSVWATSGECKAVSLRYLHLLITRFFRTNNHCCLFSHPVRLWL